MRTENIIFTDSAATGEFLRKRVAHYEESPIDPMRLGLLIDGYTLAFVMEDHLEVFSALAKLSSTVVCCRMTPRQKAQIVKMVQHKHGKMTLAVGDGANDVPMIAAANIGVGIMGKEGSQAQRSGDYAIGEFQFLERLILIHGRYSYLRVAKMIQYFFYKNFMYILPQLWFGVYNGWTAQTLYESWTMTFYNTLFTALPPYIMGVFEKDVSEKMLLRYPRSYVEPRTSYALNTRTVTYWALSGFFHSVMIFWGVALEQGNNVAYDGKENGLWYMGTVQNTVAVSVGLLHIAMDTMWWTVVERISFSLSYLIYLAFLVIIAGVFSIAPEVFYVFYRIMEVPTSYLLVLMLVVGAMIPNVAYLVWRRWYHPQNWHILQEMDVIERKSEKRTREWIAYAQMIQNWMSTAKSRLSISGQKHQAQARSAAGLEMS
eukprot:GFYU01012788.1.p1 GENE.GFYU01012788.1~~GFYU01012788.1.p1  ORF type:complete len:473 (-),score=133.71 GFYU01012788.1:1440-2729(-)